MKVAWCQIVCKVLIPGEWWRWLLLPSLTGNILLLELFKWPYLSVYLMHCSLKIATKLTLLSLDKYLPTLLGFATLDCIALFDFQLLILYMTESGDYLPVLFSMCR